MTLSSGCAEFVNGVLFWDLSPIIGVLAIQAVHLRQVQPAWDESGITGTSNKKTHFRHSLGLKILFVLSV